MVRALQSKGYIQTEAPNSVSSKQTEKKPLQGATSSKSEDLFVSTRSSGPKVTIGTEEYSLSPLIGSSRYPIDIQTVNSTIKRMYNKRLEEILKDPKERDIIFQEKLKERKYYRKVAIDKIRSGKTEASKEAVEQIENDIKRFAAIGIDYYDVPKSGIEQIKSSIPRYAKYKARDEIRKKVQSFTIQTIYKYDSVHNSGTSTYKDHTKGGITEKFISHLTGIEPYPGFKKALERKANLEELKAEIDRMKKDGSLDIFLRGVKDRPLYESMRKRFNVPHKTIFDVAQERIDARKAKENRAKKITSTPTERTEYSVRTNKGKLYVIDKEGTPYEMPKWLKSTYFRDKSDNEIKSILDSGISYYNVKVVHKTYDRQKAIREAKEIGFRTNGKPLAQATENTGIRSKFNIAAEGNTVYVTDEYGIAYKMPRDINTRYFSGKKDNQIQDIIDNGLPKETIKPYQRIIDFDKAKKVKDLTGGGKVKEPADKKPKVKPAEPKKSTPKKKGVTSDSSFDELIKEFRGK